MSSCNPWGVSLKSRGSGDPATSPSPKPTGQSPIINSHRSTLRPAKTVEKRLPRKTNSRKYKLKTTPFEISREPIFGVVLRSTKKETDESLIDLNFNAGNSQSNSESTNEASNEYAPFGVRLKPVRRRYDKEEASSRTYQIDLNPRGKVLLGKYQPESKDFLELKLKAVQRTAKQIQDEEPEFIELQLRHVVAPADGGPKRAVTQATFRIPLLNHVNLEQLLKEHKVRAMENAKDPLAELLQLQIQMLNPTTIQPSQIPESQTIQIQLRHVDPKTRELTDMGPYIRVDLKKTPPMDDDSQHQQPKGEMPPSMQVSLKHVSPQHREHHDATPDFAKVHLKQCVVQEEEEELFQEEEISDDSETSLEGDNKGMEDASEKLEALALAAGKQDMRSSLPNLDFEQAMKKKGEEEDEYEEHVLVDEKEDDKPKEEATVEAEAEEPKAERTGRTACSTGRKTPQRTRSSSLTKLDQLRKRRDRYVERSAKETQEPERELTNQQRRDLLMWYNRMKTPNKENMKRRVAKLPSSCDITPEDVDLLPWVCKGRFLDLRVMNQYFMEDWQGKEEPGLKKTDGNLSD